MRDSMLRRTLKSYKNYRINNQSKLLHTIFEISAMSYVICRNKNSSIFTLKNITSSFVWFDWENTRTQPFFSIPNLGFLDWCIESDAIINQCIEQTTNQHSIRWDSTHSVYNKYTAMMADAINCTGPVGTSSYTVISPNCWFSRSGHDISSCIFN